MRDVLFTCPNCSKALALPGESIGKAISCPQCQNNVSVPEANVEFSCPACNAQLSAPSGLGGKAFDCPSCRWSVTVPGEKPEEEAKGWY